MVWVQQFLFLSRALLLLISVRKIRKADQRALLSMRHYTFQNIRCARFSPDGRFVATRSADTSIKLFEFAKIKQMLLPDAKDGPVRPVIQTFYDHTQPINDLDFHPQGSVLISGAKDQTIKFFNISKTNVKRAYRVIQVLIEFQFFLRSIKLMERGKMVLFCLSSP